MADFTIEAGVIVSINKTKCEFTNYGIHIVGILHNDHIVYVKYNDYVIEPSYNDKPRFRIGDTVETGVNIEFSNSTNASAVMTGWNLRRSSTDKCSWLNTPEPAFTLREISIVKFGLDNGFKRAKTSNLFDIPVQTVTNITHKVCRRLLDIDCLGRLTCLPSSWHDELNHYIKIYLYRLFPEVLVVMETLKDKPEVLNAYYKSL